MKTFKSIPEADMMTKYINDVFWYVFDETNQQVIASPNDQAMEPIGYVFQEREDAEKWKFLISKTPAYQDLKLRVEGKPFISILEDVKEALGEFQVAAISHAEAENLFENYPDYLQFYGWKPEEDDE